MTSVPARSGPPGQSLPPGSTRVAMRVDSRDGSEIYYLHTDHLGSVSLVTDGTGQVVAQQLYHPFGTVRWSEGTLPTAYGFTG